MRIQIRNLQHPLCNDHKVQDKNIGEIVSTLDEKDWILLEAVQADARLPFAQLARDASLSPPAAAERLRRLEDAGIIRGFHAQVDPAALGLAMNVLIDVQVRRDDYAKFQKLVSHLTWVLECHHITGRAAFLVKAAVPDVEGLERLIGVLSQFGETTTSLILSTVVKRREFRRKAAFRE